MNERERLEKVIEEEGMSAKQFAHEVGIQAGTISNILSGRNNPSLEVMKRVLNRFRTLSSDWLILGVGSMYRQNGAAPDNALFDIRPVEPQAEPEAEAEETKSVISKESSAVGKNTAAKTVDKIVIFYSDGTFEER